MDALQILRGMTLRQKLGQMLMISLECDEMDDAARALIEEYQPGNIALFGKNITTAKKLARFCGDLQETFIRACGAPALIGIDQEGGAVNRAKEGVALYPGAMALGAADDSALTCGCALRLAQELRALGVNFNFAPVADVNINPRNPVIGARSFGDRPHSVARHASAFTLGLAQGGMAACVKHFPGHGDTATDSHFGLPKVDKPLSALEECELAPFRAAIAAGAQAVMTAHILYPALEKEEIPATLSRAILINYLRETLKFDGVIVSDGMHMDAIKRYFGLERGCVEAAKAGCDLIIVGTGGNEKDARAENSCPACMEALTRAAETGELPLSRIDDAALRVLTLKEELGLLSEDFSLLKPCPPHREYALYAARKCVSVLRGEGSLPLPRGALRISFEPGAGAGVFEGDKKDASLRGFILPLDPDDTQAKLALDAALKAPAVILNCRQALTHPAQAALVNLISKSVPRAAVLLAGAPYDLAAFPEAKTVLCAYGLNDTTRRAAMDILMGKCPATAKIPVTMEGLL